MALAAAAGVSETVIGLTLVAVGTSLPELTVSLVAAFRPRGANRTDPLQGPGQVSSVTWIVSPVMPEELFTGILIISRQMSISVTSTW
jgi:Ca2+/Na+ antiporter